MEYPSENRPDKEAVKAFSSSGPHKAEESPQLRFTDEDIRDIVELGGAIRRIRARLIAEGKMSDKTKTA